MSGVLDGSEIFRRVFELAPMPIGISRLDTGELLFANRALVEMLGRSPEEVVGRPVLEVGIWASDAERARIIEWVRERGHARDVELEVRHRDGTRRLTLASFERLHVDGVDCLVGALQDITERAAADAARAESEQRLQTILASAGEGVFGLDRDGRVTFANPAAARLLDRGVDALMGARFHEMAHHSRPDGTPLPLERCSIQRTLDAGHAARTDREVFWVGGGTPLPVEYRTAPLVVDGDVVGAVVTFDEVEARVVARRTVEAARDEAQAASAAKTRFLSHMSHELRTPLNSVLGFAELLGMRDLPADAHAEVEQVQRAGRHLLDLIDDALDISRIESGQLSFSLEAVHLGEVLAEVVSLVGPMAEEAAVDLRWEAPEDISVRADTQRLRQVLLNLLSNAVKYNGDGGEVRVTAVGAGERVVVEVADTGRGIPPERLAELFEPFERVGRDTSGVAGTGLGLALTRGLVEAMGGSVEVDSVEGEGSTFRVRLPRADGAVRPSAGDGGGSGARAASVDGTAEVLYVEDNPANVRLIEAALRTRPGVRLATAMYGQVGLELARQHPPDLVLLDLHLPDTAGEEVLRCLRADPVTCDCRVLVVSADATRARIRRAREAGADDYLTKPVEVHRLLEEVDAVLGSPGA